MGRRTRKPLPRIEGLELTDAVAGGKAMGRHENVVVFVAGAVPGDVVDVQVTRKKKNFMEARVLKVHQFSDMRTEPFCEHFGVCGGCKWQFMDYKHQLHFKAKEVTGNLSHLGGVKVPTAAPILASANTQYYRNKLEFTFSNKRWLIDKDEVQSDRDMNGLGFHVPGRFDKVVDVKHCYLQGSKSNDIRNAVRAYALDNDLPFFDIRGQHGFLRNLIIRSTSTGELMVIVVFYENREEAITKLLNHLKEGFPEITSLQYIVNTKKNDSIGDQEVICFDGKDHIMEAMEDLQFKIGPKSFYQTNSDQAYELYKIARDYARLEGNELVYDLYTGTGTIANFLARSAKKVIGIEYVPEAIEDAKVNSELNGIENTDFFAGDMKDVLTRDFIAEHGRPDVIVTDPPRAGMHEKVIQRILEAAPERVVYVSCNPATQARDLGLMDAHYRIVKVQPVDMFPHTHHVENVVLLKKR